MNRNSRDAESEDESMAKVILICGKICSGKTYYARQLRDQYNAVILSTDEGTVGTPLFVPSGTPDHHTAPSPGLVPE